MNKKLSIVIPVYNNWNYTKYCLENFSNLPEEYEVIIVDNGSQDATNQEIQQYLKDNIKHIRLETNTGFGFACNLGYKNSIGESVLFLNNDIKIMDKNFEWLYNFANTVSVIQENILFGPTGGLIDVKNDFKFLYETNDENKKINYMSGWCLAARKEVWNKLILSGLDGPFDCKSFFAYFEDTDLSCRAQELKMQFRFYSLPLIHIGRQTSKNLNTNQLYTKSKEVFKKKWIKKAHLFDQWK